MKKLITDYTFDASAKQITFAEPVALSQVLLVTNTTDNTIVYNFASPSLGGVMTGNTLTLNFDSAAMSDTDALQIYVDDAEAPAAEKTQGAIAGLLSRILALMLSPLGYDKSLSRSRVTAILESGTVSTVTTVSNVSTIDTMQGRILVNGANLTAWQLSVREKIS